jgi:hypothetical protein
LNDPVPLTIENPEPLMLTDPLNVSVELDPLKMVTTLSELCPTVTLPKATDVGLTEMLMILICSTVTKGEVDHNHPSVVV